MNRDDNDWELTNLRVQLMRKDSLAKGNLRKVIRLMKYLGTTRTPSPHSLHTADDAARRAGPALRTLIDPNYYSDVPTALLHIVNDLDAWLQDRPTKFHFRPVWVRWMFDHRWEQSTYSYFETASMSTPRRSRRRTRRRTRSAASNYGRASSVTASRHRPRRLATRSSRQQLQQPLPPWGGLVAQDEPPPPGHAVGLAEATR